MASNLTGVLKHLTTTFTVKDIMVPEVQLTCAYDFESASHASAAHPDYSIIPIRSFGVISGYFERDTGRTRSIDIGDLISDGTSLLDLVEILDGRDFSFVLSNRRIDGYVHYSDLNHQLMKWTFYMILEAVERLSLDALPAENERSFLQEKLGPKRFQQILDVYKRAKDNGRSLFTYLNIADLLRLAVSEGAFEVDESVVGMIKDVRDWVSHVILDLPADSAVQTLIIVKRECFRILGEKTQTHKASVGS